MGLRIILTIVILWLVYTVARRYLQQRHQHNVADRNKRYQKTVRCEHCGTHLPAAEALSNAGKDYCCQAHLEADRQPPGGDQ